MNNFIYRKSLIVRPFSLLLLEICSQKGRKRALILYSPTDYTDGYLRNCSLGTLVQNTGERPSKCAPGSGRSEVGEARVTGPMSAELRRRTSARNSGFSHFTTSTSQQYNYFAFLRYFVLVAIPAYNYLPEHCVVEDFGNFTSIFCGSDSFIWLRCRDWVSG